MPARTDTRRLAYVAVDDLPPAPRNPKRHELAGITASIRRNGFVEPVIVDERTGRLVGGHGRVEAVTAMRDAGEPPPAGVTVTRGVWKLPTVQGWASESDADAEALLVAMNRLPEAGGWESDGLADLLASLAADDAGLAGTGYGQSDLDALLASLAPIGDGIPDPDPEPEPEPDPGPHVVHTLCGDVWTLGPHRLICGDSRDPAVVAELLAGATINLAVTSPPYAEQRDYDAASGFVPIKPDDYVAWFAPVAANVAAHLADDGSWLVNIKPAADGLDRLLYVFDLVAAHVREWGWHFGDELCWERNGVPKNPAQRLKNQFEPVYQFARGRWKFRPQHVRHPSDAMIVALGEGAGDTAWNGRGDVPGQGVGDFISPAQRAATDARRKRPRRTGTTELMSSVQGGAPHDVGEALADGWAYPGNRLPTFAGSHEAVGHAAAYPVGLPAFLARLYTDPGDVVYDPFAGSGSTVLAAHHTGRVGYGVELSPAYCDMICRRWHRATGVVPTRAGQPFPDLDPTA